MADKQTVVLDSYFRRVDQIFTPEDLARLKTMANVVWGKDEPMPDDFLDGIEDEVFAIIIGRWRHGPLERFPKLKAIMEVGGRHPSPQQLDYQSCFARNIRVLSCAPAFGPVVAEMALGMVLAASREIVIGHNLFPEGKEQYSYKGNVSTFSLYNQTVGLIGFGGLARCLKPLLDPFGCTYQVYDPWLPETHLTQQGVIPTDLDTLLSTSKVIFVLAIPSTSNNAMLDRSRLALIQPGSVFALISRAHMVDFDALTEIVQTGRFKAVIDVFPEEPLPDDHPIRHVSGTVLSAHRAGSVNTAYQSIGRMVVNDLMAMLAGLPPLEMQVAQPELIHRLS